MDNFYKNILLLHDNFDNNLKTKKYNLDCKHSKNTSSGDGNNDS